MQKILNVANRLPITVGEEITKSSGGLVSALEGVSGSDYDLRWIGWPGHACKSPEEERELEETLSERFGYKPIFLSAEEISDYYDGFSNSSLWPILHYNANYMRYEEPYWEAYKAVNQKFADSVLETASEGDLVWIHDYHLMLVPGMLRAAMPNLRIGFFFHTPFPSSEVFRCHPRRAELIEGVLGADLLGFHTFNYLRHFRSSALRLVGLESDMGTISHGTHRTTLGVYPIGINAKSFEEELQTEAFRKKKDEFSKNWSGKRIALSVERLDYSKGLPHRLEAIEQFLANYDDRDNIVFVFVSVPTRGGVEEYQLLLERIEGEVGRINGRYATTRNSPIHFIHGSVPFTELCALYSIADIAMVTPLVDGMNLVAKEYVACQSNDPGVLILSEFAGAANELVNALIVNPFDTRAVAEAIDTALAMDLEERRDRMGYMRSRVTQFEANFWANSFLTELKKLDQFEEYALTLNEAREEVLNRVKSANKVALFLDYDGTLREFEKIPDRAYPSPAVIDLFLKLEGSSADVFVISGRNGATLHRWFGKFDATLIAEHGSAYKLAGSEDWESLNPSDDDSWKARVLEIMRHYEGSTPGSFVEEKQSAIVWHYRQSDPEFGKWKANQLMSESYEMLANFPVEIHHGKKIIEVSSIHVNKGAAVNHFLNKADYDLVICAGDDQTDEAMFRLENDRILTLKIGDGESHARYRIPDPASFRTLMSKVATHTTDAGGVTPS